MARDKGINEMLVSVLDKARSVGGTHGENHFDRLEDVERSAMKSNAVARTRSSGSKTVCPDLVSSMVLTT